MLEIFDCKTTPTMDHMHIHRPMMSLRLHSFMTFELAAELPGYPGENMFVLKQNDRVSLVQVGEDELSGDDWGCDGAEGYPWCGLGLVKSRLCHALPPTPLRQRCAFMPTALR